jgi:polysaccharide biosynthesis/export protein
MTRSWLFFTISLLFLGACVPNRKIVYLQKDDLNRKDLRTDTIVRTHNLKIEEYKIQPLDLLYIRIESLTEDEYDFITKLYSVNQTAGASSVNNQFISGFLVDNNGEIEFPVVGRINFQGLSVFAAQEKLQETFKPYLKNPVARVRLMNFRFTVLGEVNAENQVVSNNTRVTLMEAIGLAGGLSDLADRSNVKIIRQDGGQAKVLYVNLLDENFLTSPHYYIHQNDIIVVPPLRQRPFRKYWGQNLALLVSTLSLALLVYNITQ